MATATSVYARKSAASAARTRMYKEKLINTTTTANNQESVNDGNEGRRRSLSGCWGLLRLPRIIFIIFHPAVIALAIMIGLLSFKLNQIIKNGSGQRNVAKSKNIRPLERSDSTNLTSIQVPDSITLSKYDESRDRDVSRSRIKRFAFVERDEDYPMIFKYRKRPIPLTSLDDMLLDAETPLETSLCIPEDMLHRLEDQDKVNKEKKGSGLSEYKEKCETNDDCMQVSPYIWEREGTREPCRKKTYLRCNRTEKACQCLDEIDAKWNTETSQSTYQWNPITKTCYVRGTNPCKQEIPCAPGTTCRTTVSITFNTPPLQRICECTDIQLVISAGNEDWWYCKTYWQRTWLYDLDNINKWEHVSYHTYSRMKHGGRLNSSEEETNTMELQTDEHGGGLPDSEEE